MFDGMGGSGVGGGGMSSSALANMLAGYATQTWVGDNYVSIEFFNRLFRVHGSDDVVIVPNDVETTIQNIEARFGLWTESFLSALGLNSSGSGGGGGASYLNDLLDVNISSPATGDGLVFDGTRWVNGPVGGGGSGSVERVALTMPTGFSVAGSPVTSSGTLAVTFASGYSLPTTEKQNQWDIAYGWGDHSVQGYATQEWVNSMLPSSTDISHWNTAYSNSHTHSNKSVLDGITSTKTSHWDAAYGWGNHADAGYATQTALANATSRIGTLEGYFSGGSAKTALRLAGNDTHYAWGQPFWQNGTPKSIGSASARADIRYAGSVNMGHVLAMEYDGNDVHDPAIYMKALKTDSNLPVLMLHNDDVNNTDHHLAIGFGTSARAQLPIRFFGREFVFNFTTDTVNSSGYYQTAEAMKVGYRSFGTEKEPAVYVRKHLMIGNGADDYFPVTYDSANNALCFTGNIYATGGISALGFQSTPGGGTLFNGPFTVNGAAILRSTLNVTGAATLNSSLTVADTVTMNDNLDVSANARIGGSLTALGTTTLNDALTVTGAATFRDSIYIYYGGTRYTLSISKLINQGLLT